MAQSIPTACIPPPLPGHLSGICFFSKKLLQMPHIGASTFIEIPTAGLREEGKYPSHGTRSKFYLMIVAKNILLPLIFSGFSHGF